MTKTEFVTKINDTLWELEDWELVSVWNEYCNHNNCTEDYIYDMDEFDNYYRDSTPTEIVNDIDSDFDTSDDFFRCTQYGTVSFTTATDNIDKYELGDLSNYIVGNLDALGCEALQEIIDEYEDEESEDED